VVEILPLQGGVDSRFCNSRWGTGCKCHEFAFEHLLQHDTKCNHDLQKGGGWG